ncbi:probable cytochrome P450 6d5 [Lutzomyia longipalpis]|uniref:probable cytochrome P450 6d5 n=1 Tax=Lutzomyia longipalpis TaxID=7200 RepID=UPI0024840348|nr:probable cytochrome P450 6d5 [Lutzomyia longipalpis]
MVFGVFFVSFVCATIGVIYLYLKRSYRYWEKRNVTYIKPTVPFGNMKDVLLGRTDLGSIIRDLYNQSREKFFGIYMINRPALIIRDPELIKAIMIKDFDHFVDRGIFVDEEMDPISGNLFSLTGQKWHKLRIKLTPTFTSGKLRAMFPSVMSSAENMQKHLLKNLNNHSEGNVHEVRDLTARFLTDLIASVAFGINVNSIADPNAHFRKMGQKALAPTFRNGIVVFLSFMAPKVLDYLKLKQFDDDVEKFMVSIVEQTVKHREKNNVVREDFMQLLIQLRNSGTVKDDGDWSAETVDKQKQTMTFNEIAAQAAVFFLAGFETSSSVISFCLYELAKNPEMQERAYREIKQVLADNNWDYSYEGLKQMKYLECCMDEILRIYPPAPSIIRICTKDYKIPETNVTIEKGTNIFIPIWGLQKDPKYFENPEKYNPERFLPVNSDKRVPFTYLPFGEGPRSCIGARMGRLNAKVGLAVLLQTFRFELGPTMGQTLKMEANQVLLQPVDGIKLRFIPREQRGLVIQL